MPETRGRYHHGDLRNALLVAVDGALRDDGVTGLSLRRVAARAGVSHTAAAHHFGDFAGLVASYAQASFETFAVALDAAADAHGASASAEARLLASGQAYVDFALEHPARYEVMFRDDLHPPAHAGLEAAGEHAFAQLLARVRACFVAAPGDDVVLRCAVTAWSTVHGLAHLLIDGPLSHVLAVDTDAPVIAELRDGVMRTLHQALRAEPGWQADPELLAAS